MKRLPRRSWMLLVALVASAAWAAEPLVSSRGALVRFHTACAMCHAAECSGRQSFQSGAQAAAGHIRRYAPSADAAMVRELFKLLATVKRTCRVELPDAGRAGRHWKAETLRPWFNPDVDAWFIPLGGPRGPPLVLEFNVREASAGATVEVLDAELETIARAPLGPGRATLEVTLPPTGAYVLLRGVRVLLELEVKPAVSK